ncbi:MAG: aconitate hydratase AcnA [Actinobacteria bacterium]|nr:aconitate hydratase AcnA [Actinomycetota bacterium]
MNDSFGARDALTVAGRERTCWRLDALEGEHAVSRLPYTVKVLLESLLRNEDGDRVTADDVAALAAWTGTHDEDRELAFLPARVLMQDFTGVPAIVDIAAMRDAMAELGGDPSRIEPQIPAELVIDHSVSVDVFGTPDAFRRNAELEFERNRERYALLRWGQQAFHGLRVVPPDTGIVHQVNVEYLARVVVDDGDRLYPDTVVGTDSHTPMVNGLGVLGWGVGGIEAEAAMLGQPVPLSTPRVIGVRLVGSLPEGATATDLVLTVTERLRQHGVVGAFVEFYGEGVSAVPLATRATIGNMSPEYGSTSTIFPIDDETLRYLRFTGRDPEHVDLVEGYARAQGLFHDPDLEPVYSETLVLDLGAVTPSLAGPSRPQDRVALTEAKPRFRQALADLVPPEDVSGPDASSDESFPASDPPASMAGGGNEGELPNRAHHPTPVEMADGRRFELDHGDVVIAAITSCTNTSNPHVMLAAGLLAKNAVDRGLDRQPWVKTSLAPGSQVVMDYFERAGLLPYLEKLGFHLVGFGCTTCIGNSGPLATEISRTVQEADLAVVSVLSGNRNFAGRIHADVKMNYLASPPLVVAYALAGTMDIDLYSEPLGVDANGQEVFLRDIWPSDADVGAAVEEAVRPEMFRERYADVFSGDEPWTSLPVPSGDRFAWDERSTYIRRPTFLTDIPADPPAVRDVHGARALAVLGDSTTTDHISPAGVIRVDSPAGRYLVEHGVDARDFNSYGARRGNHEVMVRGTFANVRLRNQLVPDVEGGYSRHLPDGEVEPIYDVAMRYRDEGTPLVVLAGKEYGSGSSRDWAAKGTLMQGIRAVIAESYERIHRSNLIGMGVLPLQFRDGESVASLGLKGEEALDIVGLEDAPGIPDTLTVRADGTGFEVLVRIDTPTEAAYYRHGGILPYVLRQLRGA